MDRNERDFIELVKRTVTKDYIDDGYFDNTDWNAISALAYFSSIEAVLFDVAKVQKSLPEGQRNAWDQYKFDTSFREMRNMYCLSKVLEKLKTSDIDYVIFKGPIIADCYPNYSYRYSSDSDILVSEQDKQQACDLINSLGYEAKEEKSNSQVTYFKNTETNHAIELHTCLFEHYEGQKIEVLKSLKLDDPSKRIDYVIKDKTYRTLGATEHLVFQFFHLIKHFVLEGASIKFFLDIVMFINKNIDKIDIDYFWECMRKCNYVDFCENFLTICIDYLAMDNSIMQGHKCKADQEVLDALLVDYIYNGDKENRRKKTWQLLGTMKPYLVGDNTSINKSKFERIIHYIFVKPSELNKRYSYAKKIPALLPIAWMHRALRRLVLPLFNKNTEAYTGVEKVELVEDRLRLFASVGILDEE